LSMSDAIGSYDHADATQMALDSIFNLVMRLGQNSDASFQQLRRATTLIDELLKIVRPEHYGPALYYKFKHRHFLGLYLEEQGFLLAALERYKEAALVWWEMHKLKSYGSGNGAHDPYAEGCAILYDIAALSYSHQDFETCLESIHHILHFYKEVWGLRSQIPQPVLKKHALHLGIGGSCAMSNGNDTLALKYLSEALSIFKQMPEELQYITHTESMVEELLQRKERNKKAKATPEEEISITGEALSSPNRRVHRRKKKH
jgi:tetratricopeptide (TPR) repeat protein